MKNLLYMLLTLSLILGLSNCSYIQDKIQNIGINSEIKKDFENGKVLSLFNPVNNGKEAVVKSYLIRGFYLLADGIYSTSTDFIVPKLKTDFLEDLIDKLRHGGGGYI